MKQTDFSSGLLGSRVRQHWPFLLVAATVLTLFLTNLGRERLWSDEGDTAVLASNILKFGVPKAWDGITFTDTDLGARVNDDLVMVSHPWLQYYVTAGAFAAFGQNAFAARLPFALSGWFTLIAGYLIVWRITADRRAAFSTAALLAFSPQFLLYGRQCRNYSLNMLLTFVLLATFLRMRSARHAVGFTITAILLFHTHPIGIVPVGALGLLTLTYRPFAPMRRWFWLAAPAICVFTLPWFALAERGYEENAALAGSVSDFIIRCAQYLIEFASVTPLIGVAVVVFGTAMKARFQSKPKAEQRASVTSGDRQLHVCVAAIVIFYVLAMAMTQPSHAMWIVGVRYTPAVISLAALSAGIVIARSTSGRFGFWVVLLVLFCVTKLAQLTPWLAGLDKITTLGKARSLEAHIPLRTLDCFINTDEILLVRDLWEDNRGSVGEVCDFLETYSQVGDHLVANVDYDPLYFHTRLPQNLKILPGYPVRDRALRKNLPGYVFSIAQARWVIWRPFWEGTDGYNWPDVQQDIAARGGRMVEVAEINETVWENRENIHFRRYAGGKYLFSGFENLPRGKIFRIDWN